MMYVNKQDQCFNLSLAYILFIGFDYTVHAGYQRNHYEPIERFSTEQEAIDFIHWVAQESNK